MCLNIYFLLISLFNLFNHMITNYYYRPNKTLFYLYSMLFISPPYLITLLLTPYFLNLFKAFLTLFKLI